MNLRVRGPSGQSTLSGVDPSATAETLCAVLSAETGIPPSHLEVLSGFPPRQVPLASCPAEETVEALGIRTGDVLTVRRSVVVLARVPAGAEAGARAEAAAGAAAPAPAAVPAPAVPSAPVAPSAPPASTVGDQALAQALAQEDMDEDEALARAIAASLDDASPSARDPASTPAPAPASGSASLSSAPALYPPTATAESAPVRGPSSRSWVVRRPVPDDNSCLFSAVGVACGMDEDAKHELRRMAAQAVSGDPISWDEATLGRPRGEYVAWISRPNSWGGAIELAILSRALGSVIKAFDVQTGRVDAYGDDAEGAGAAGGADAKPVAMVLYDGIHYDALQVVEQRGEGAAAREVVASPLPAGSRDVEPATLAAQELAQERKRSHAYTDVSKFTLRCMVCGKGIVGEKEAIQHAKQTGHDRFDEYA